MGIKSKPASYLGPLEALGFSVMDLTSVAAEYEDEHVRSFSFQPGVTSVVQAKVLFFSCSGLIGCSDGFTKELLQNTLGTDFAEESYARPVPKGSRSCCLVHAFTDGHH